MRGLVIIDGYKIYDTFTKLLYELKGITKVDKVIVFFVEKPSTELIKITQLLEALKIKVHNISINSQRGFFKIIADIYSILKYLTKACSITFVCIGKGDLQLNAILAILPLLEPLKKDVQIVIYMPFLNDIVRLDNIDLRTYKYITSHTLPIKTIRIVNRLLMQGTSSLNDEEINRLEKIGIIKRDNAQLKISDIAYLALIHNL